MSWKNFTKNLVVNHCNKEGSRTFTLKKFIEVNDQAIIEFSDNNKFPKDKIRQQLQYLRDDGFLSFVDNRGTYTLRGVDLLSGEVEDKKISDILTTHPDKKEYLIEVFARNVGWVKKAKDFFGYSCLFKKCDNTFLKEDGIPYIEVHHIIPLHKGGEEELWNLSTLCAHHHRMAHYADTKKRIEIENNLLREVECLI